MTNWKQNAGKKEFPVYAGMTNRNNKRELTIKD